MQPRLGLHPLILRHSGPVGAACLARRSLAGTRRHPMQDRPIQGLIDDLVSGGHGRQPLLFRPLNLSRSVADRYVETSENVQ